MGAILHTEVCFTSEPWKKEKLIISRSKNEVNKSNLGHFFLIVVFCYVLSWGFNGI